MRRRSIFSGTLAILMLAALIAAGCGKKGDPVPSRLILPPAMADLTAESTGEGIVLAWSAPGSTGGIDHFRIFRSEAAADQACPGCPQDYRPLASPKLTDQALQRAGERSFRYVDAAVSAGRFYAYRVSACDAKGNCGEPTHPAQRFR
jgi:predicted small lipoprotein YifL